jgi:hypothetical protein
MTDHASLSLSLSLSLSDRIPHLKHVQQHLQKPRVQFLTLVQHQRRQNVAHIRRQNGHIRIQMHLPIHQCVLCWQSGGGPVRSKSGRGKNRGVN